MDSKFPFQTNNINESDLKEWLVQVIYPREFLSGGGDKSAAKKRVNSRIYYARKNNALAQPKRGLVEATSFFEWACKQRGWEALLDIYGLPRNATVGTVSPSPGQGKTGTLLAMPVPSDPEALKIALLTAYKDLAELRDENKALRREREQLLKYAEKQEKRSAEGREHGRKGRGVKKHR